MQRTKYKSAQHQTHCWHWVKHCPILIFLPHVGQPAEDQHAHYHHQHQQPQLFITGINPVLPQHLCACQPVLQREAQGSETCYMPCKLEDPEYSHYPEYLSNPAHLGLVLLLVILSSSLRHQGDEKWHEIRQDSQQVDDIHHTFYKSAMENRRSNQVCPSNLQKLMRRGYKPDDILKRKPSNKNSLGQLKEILFSWNKQN